MRARLEDRHVRPNMRSRIARGVAGTDMLAVRIGLIGMQYGKEFHDNLHFCACVCSDTYLGY
jgi:hypothetical protein